MSTPLYLSERFTALAKEVEKSGDYAITEEFQRLSSTYSTMLDYMARGIDDPQFDHLHRQIQQQLHSLQCQLQRLQRMSEPRADRYTITARMQHNVENVADCIALIKSQGLRTEAIANVFNYVWTCDLWSKSDNESAVALLFDESILPAWRPLFVSAATLALLEMFDEQKLMFLFDAYLCPDTQISQRALVGIVLVLRKYDTTLDEYPESSARLSLLMDDSHFVDGIFRVLMQLHHSTLTDSISQQMRDDIIPAIMQREKKRGHTYGIKEIDDFMSSNGENPEWLRSDDDDAAAEQKLRDMAELQMEGADVYMASFCHLKGFSFFHSMAHWFMPFTPTHPDILPLTQKLSAGNTSIIQTLIEHAPFCDSDLYSFCLMFQQAGEHLAEAIQQQWTAELDGEDIESVIPQHPKAQKPAEVSRNYIFDLFRFYKVYPFHSEFVNPFDSKTQAAFTPLSTEIFKPLMAHREQVISLADYLMRKADYTDAEKLYRTLSPRMEEEDAKLWQKIGFCQQKLKRADEALVSYSTAYALEPTSRWTLRHLASMCHQQHNYAEATEYYQILLEHEPENLRLLSRAADCLMETGDYEQARALLYKATYLDEQALEARHQLAHCLLMTRETDKANDICLSILQEEPTDSATLITLGNIALFQNNRTAAYGHYLSARRSMDDNQEFISAMESNAQRIGHLGIEPRLIHLLTEAVIYNHG